MKSFVMMNPLFILKLYSTPKQCSTDLIPRHRFHVERWQRDGDCQRWGGQGSIIMREGVRRQQRRLNWGFSRTCSAKRLSVSVMPHRPTQAQSTYFQKKLERNLNCNFFYLQDLVDIYIESSYDPELYVCMFSPFCIYANYFHLDPMQYY